jgi:uncharacterized membrane protein YgdD (TMEM256/DUF423 family)
LRHFVGLAGIIGALGVAAGAFGAHALRPSIPPRALEIWQTAVDYQLVHALALLGLALFAERRPLRLVEVAGWLFFGGVVLFSGSLYVLAMTGVGWLGAVTPLGGLAFIVGWSCLAVAGLARPKS